MEKKLSTMQLGAIKDYDDVIHNIMNATTRNLTVENLTCEPESQSICYQLLRSFAALFLQPDWKRWSDSFKNEPPQLPY